MKYNFTQIQNNNEILQKQRHLNFKLHFRFQKHMRL